MQQTVERLANSTVKYDRVGLIGDIAVSLAIDQLGSSLSHIKATAVMTLELAEWTAIRKVKEAMTSEA